MKEANSTGITRLQRPLECSAEVNRPSEQNMRVNWPFKIIVTGVKRPLEVFAGVKQSLNIVVVKQFAETIVVVKGMQKS